MPLLGAIANQCHRATPRSEDSNDQLQKLCEVYSTDLAGDTVNRMMARMRSAHNRLLMLQSYEQDLVSSVRRGLTSHQGLHLVPKIKGEVHDLPALFKVGQYLMEDS